MALKVENNTLIFYKKFDQGLDLKVFFKKVTFEFVSFCCIYSEERKLGKIQHRLVPISISTDHYYGSY